MKNKYIYILIFISTVVKAQIGIQNIAPQAQLDITATDRGLLIPRIALTSLSAQLPVTNPQGGNIVESTLIYHNGTNNITAGFYYWDGLKWQGYGKTDENKGLQFYLFTGSASSPEINKNLNFPIANSGLWTAPLNDTARSTITTQGDNYMILFSGTLVVETAGQFRLQSVSDDGSRVIIDDIPVLNRWIDQSTTSFDGYSVFLAKGKHKIEFWYYERQLGQSMTFNWLQNANGGTLPRTVSGTDFIIE